MKICLMLVWGIGCLCWHPMTEVPVMKTGGKMPREWIDADTRHRVVRLTDAAGGENGSFYFHDNPFVGDTMVFYHRDTGRLWQLAAVDLHRLNVWALTREADKIVGEIVGPTTGDVYYQVRDSVFVANVRRRGRRLVYVFPADFKGTVTTLNADGHMLAGIRASAEEAEILRRYPEKHDYFNRIYDAHLPHELFVIDVGTGKLRRIYAENEWLGHVQFSPTDPNLLMFCHEGPWQKVDRIWTIDIGTGVKTLRHARTVDNEIAGHEFFAPDGQRIWYDLQIPKGQVFYLGITDIHTGAERKLSLTRNEWSIHFTVSADQRLLAGDGGDAGQVAKAEDGRWIYLFRSAGDRLVSERLVNMKDQQYKLEPNVHFSPDGRWVIFRANFEGHEDIYAVSVQGSD